MSNKPEVNLICVYSLPRSGSTVLIAQLERIKGIVCVSESYFPQILEFLSPTVLADSEKLAAIYLASSPDGSLLSFDEVVKCIFPFEHKKTLTQLGLAYAVKTNRDPSQIRYIVWKTTRLIGRWKIFAGADGRFIVLRRNPINVFESQFRVTFGIHNRNAIRFILFRESYESAFARFPLKSTFSIDYESIPDQIPLLLLWLSLDDVSWSEAESSLASTSAKNAWHSGVMSSFESKDFIKRMRIQKLSRILLRLGQILFRAFRPLLGPIRDYHDKKIMVQVLAVADYILNSRR